MAAEAPPPPPLDTPAAPTYAELKKQGLVVVSRNGDADGCCGVWHSMNQCCTGSNRS
jgi:hypothetical protein